MLKRFLFFACLLALPALTVPAAAQTQPDYIDPFDAATTGTMPAGWVAGQYGGAQVENTQSSSPSNGVTSVSTTVGNVPTETYQGLGSIANGMIHIKYRASSTAQAYVTLRSDGTINNGYIFKMPLAGATTLSIIKIVAGTPTTLGSGTTATATTAGTWYWVDAQIVGTVKQMRIYAIGSGAPAYELTESADTTFTAGYPGLRFTIPSTAIYTYFDDIDISDFDLETLTAALPTAGLYNDNTYAITLTGTATLWATTAPTFTWSGIPGTAISNVAVTSNNSATATLTTNAAAGTGTITDSTTNQSVPVTVSPYYRSDDYTESFDSAPVGAMPGRWFPAGLGGGMGISASAPASGANSISPNTTGTASFYNGFGLMRNMTIHAKVRGSSTSAILLRVRSDSNATQYYGFQPSLGASNALSLQKLSAGTTSTLISGTSAYTPAAGVYFWCDIQVSGTQIRARQYAVASPPPAWEITATDTSLASGYPALSGVIVSGNSPHIDDVEIRDDDVDNAASQQGGALPTTLTWGAKTYLARPNIPLAPALPQSAYTLTASTIPGVTTTGQPITITSGVATIACANGQNSVTPGIFGWVNNSAVSQVHVTANTNGIVRVGVFNSTTGVGYYAYYDATAGTIGVMQKTGGTYTVLSSSTAVPALPFWLCCNNSRDWLAVFAQRGTGQWTCKAVANTAGRGTDDWYNVTTHAGYHDVLEYSGNSGSGAGSLSLDAWTTGYFDNIGLSDCQWVTDESGTPMMHGGLYFFTTDCAGIATTAGTLAADYTSSKSALFSYDPVSGAIADISQWGFNCTSGIASGLVQDSINPKVFFNHQDGTWYYEGGAGLGAGAYRCLIAFPSDPTLGGVFALGTPADILPPNIPAHVLSLYDSDIICVGGVWYITGIYFQVVGSVNYSQVELYKCPTLTGTYTWVAEGPSAPRREGARFVQTARGVQVWAGARDASGNAVYIDTYDLFGHDLGDLTINPSSGILMEHPATIRMPERYGSYRYRMLGFDSTYATYTGIAPPEAYGTLWTADTLEITSGLTLAAPKRKVQ